MTFTLNDFRRELCNYCISKLNAVLTVLVGEVFTAILTMPILLVSGFSNSCSLSRNVFKIMSGEFRAAYVANVVFIIVLMLAYIITIKAYTIVPRMIFIIDYNSITAIIILLVFCFGCNPYL